MRSYLPAILSALLLSACADVGPRGAGTLTATLSSPHGEEGAAFVVLLGEGVREVREVGETAVHATTSGLVTRVVLINQAGGALSFELVLADVARPLAAFVQEVAGPDDELRADLTGYRLELGP